MTDLTDFLPYVTPYAAGVPDPVALHAIRQAIDKFCQETHIIQETQTPQRILTGDTVTGDFDTDTFVGIDINGTTPLYPYCTNGVEEYVVTAPTGMRPHEPQSMQVGEETLAPISIKTLEQIANWETTEGSPKYYVRKPTEHIVIMPVHATIIPVIRSRISFTILHDATEVDDRMFVLWRAPVANQALADLYMIPDQPFYDPQGSRERAYAYRSGRAKARIQINAGGAKATVFPQPVSWA